MPDSKRLADSKPESVVISPRLAPPITYPEDLPVSGRRQEIAAAIAAHQVVIVSGETGSGRQPNCLKSALNWGAVYPR